MRRDSVLRIVSSATGDVLQELHVNPATTVAHVKLRVEGTERIPVEEQLLSVAGVPLCGQDVLLRDYIEGEAMDIMLRRVESSWLLTLDGLSRGRSSFEAVRSRLRGQTEDALLLSREHGSHLARLGSEMDKAFRDTLGKVSDSGSKLLSATSDLQCSRDMVFEIVPRSSKGCRQAAEELMLCRTAVNEAVQVNGQLLADLGMKLAPPHAAVTKALRQCAAVLKDARELLLRERELVHLAKAKGWITAERAAELGSQYRAMLQAVRQDGKYLEGASEVVNLARISYRRTLVVNRNAIKQASMSLLRDQEVVFGWALDHVSELRKRDRNFVITVVEANGEALERAPEAFKHDREIVLLAVQQSDGWALQFAAEELKRDREIVLAAVRRNGWALEHTAKEMKHDYEVVLTAVQANGEALEFAADELKCNRDIVLSAVQKSSGWALQSAAEEMRSDVEVAKAAVQQSGLMLEHIASELKANSGIVLLAVRAHGLALEHASADLKQDRGIVLAATESNPLALQYAAAELRDDPEVVLAAVAKDGYALQFASEDLKCRRPVVLAAVREGGSGVLEYADPELRTDPEMLSAAALLNERARRTQLSSTRPSEKPDEPAFWNAGGSREGSCCVNL